MLLDIAIAAILSARYNMDAFSRLDLFPPYPRMEQANKARDKAKKVLYKDLRCTAWLSKYDVDVYRLHTILDQAKFIDGWKTKMPVNWIGTFHNMPDQQFNEMLAGMGVRPSMVQGRYGGHLLMLVYRPDGLRPEHVIHEALHYYYGEDDVQLAGRLGVEITSTDTTAISKEIAAHCDVR